MPRVSLATAGVGDRNLRGWLAEDVNLTCTVELCRETLTARYREQDKLRVRVFINVCNLKRDA